MSMFKTNRTIPRNHTTTYAFIAKRETKLGIKINGNEFFLEANYNRNFEDQLHTILKKTGKRLRIHKWKKIEKFSSDMSTFSCTDSKVVKSLFCNSEYLRAGYKRLNLNFSLCERITDKDVGQLMRELGPSQCLQKLTLNLSQCRNVTNDTLHFMRQSISTGLGNLNRLLLNFNRCPKIDDEGLNMLAIGFSVHVTRMKQLNLNFTECPNITDKGLLKLSKRINSSKRSLERLSLNFRGCTQLSDEGISNLLDGISQSLPNLQHLFLDFSKCPLVADKSLHKLASTYKNLKKLKSLVLSFFGCSKVTDEGATALSQSITTDSKTLNHLTLNFIACYGITPRAKQLLTNTGKVKNIQDFRPYC